MFSDVVMEVGKKYFEQLIDKMKEERLSLIHILTAFSIITDYEKGIKYPIADFEITPDVAIVDPELAETLSLIHILKIPAESSYPCWYF